MNILINLNFILKNVIINTQNIPKENNDTF